METQRHRNVLLGLVAILLAVLVVAALNPGGELSHAGGAQPCEQLIEWPVSGGKIVLMACGLEDMEGRRDVKSIFYRNNYEKR